MGLPAPIQELGERHASEGRDLIVTALGAASLVVGLAALVASLS